MTRTRGYFDDLEFVRARLNTLRQREAHRPLTAAEADELRELCLRELALISNTSTARPSRVRKTNRRRRRKRQD